MKSLFAVLLAVACATTFAQTNRTATRAASCDCGVANRVKRIVGGTETAVNAYPWMAALLTTTVDDYGRTKKYQFCGGSLVTNQHVLTAAHCFSESGLSASQVTVTLGDHDLSTKTETPNIEVRASKVTIHPNYNKKTEDSDMAILKLESPVTFSQNIKQICLPTNIDPHGKTATVAGWGTTSENGNPSMKLLEVSVPVLSQAQCASAYYGQNTITDNMICAGYPQGGKDSCQGDSGGPLMYPCVSPAGITRYTQIGVVSFGIGCGRANYPGVYSSVVKLRDFIVNNVDGAQVCGSVCA